MSLADEISTEDRTTDGGAGDRPVCVECGHSDVGVPLYPFIERWRARFGLRNTPPCSHTDDVGFPEEGRCNSP